MTYGLKLYLQKLRCRLFGHLWVHAYMDEKPYLVCLRCFSEKESTYPENIDL